MRMLSCMLVLAGAVLAGEDSPWRTDVQEARAEALKAGKPIVLLVNVDSDAL